MKKITMIKIEHCPYCTAALKAIAELQVFDKEWKGIEIEVIDENLEPQRAEKFTDYYYVPTMYVDGKKVYEAHPGESYDECLASVKRVFEASR
ncbi:MAG: glutaredoxin [Selenomonadaceae bacterium]|nr:glutaredoxin [Selenomonadaceae bacterium]